MDVQYFSGHFDTQIGLKIETASYREICKSTGFAPDEILFLTDLPTGSWESVVDWHTEKLIYCVYIEALAASEAGVQVKLLVRPGNAPLTEEIVQRFGICRDFREIKLID